MAPTYDSPGAALTARGLADPEEVDVTDATCSVEGCERADYRRGMCNMHETRLRKHGDVGGAETVRVRRETRLANFWDYVDKDGPVQPHCPEVGPCWVWTSFTFKNGYGMLNMGTTTRRAHRVAWEKTYGPIPDGLCVCHRCDNRPCVRPDHLFLGTYTDNARDMHAKGRDRNGSKPSPIIRCSECGALGTSRVRGICRPCYGRLWGRARRQAKRS